MLISANPSPFTPSVDNPLQIASKKQKHQEANVTAANSISVLDSSELRPEKKQKVVEVTHALLHPTTDSPYHNQRVVHSNSSVSTLIARSSAPTQRARKFSSDCFYNAIIHLKKSAPRPAINSIATEKNLGKKFLILSISYAILVTNNPTEENYSSFLKALESLKLNLSSIPDLQWQNLATKICANISYEETLSLWNQKLKDDAANNKVKLILKSSNVTSVKVKSVPSVKKKTPVTSKVSAKTPVKQKQDLPKSSSGSNSVSKSSTANSSEMMQVKDTENLNSKKPIESLDFSPVFYTIIYLLNENKLVDAEHNLAIWKSAKNSKIDRIQIRLLKALIICLKNKENADLQMMQKAKKVVKTAINNLKPYLDSKQTSASNPSIKFLNLQLNLTYMYIKTFMIEFSSVSIDFNKIINNFIDYRKENVKGLDNSKLTLKSALANMRNKMFKKALTDVNEYITLSDPKAIGAIEGFPLDNYKGNLVKAAILFELSRAENSEEYLQEAKDVCDELECCADLLAEKDREEVDSTLSYLLNLAKHPITKELDFAGHFEETY